MSNYTRYRRYLDEDDLAAFDTYVRKSTSCSLFSKLIEEAEKHPEYLTAYQRDLLVHDRRVLEAAEPGKVYIWVLRDMGTELLDLSSDPDCQGVLYWVRGEGPAAPLVYLVTIKSMSLGVAYGFLQQITHDAARDLVLETSPNPSRPKEL